MMIHPDNRIPFLATELSAGLAPANLPDTSVVQESAPPSRSDRLYQIAAVTAGLILLATVF